MCESDPIAEFQASWLPNISDAGLERLISLLDKASPLLVHGAFTRAMPQGCLASHIAWNHATTQNLDIEAGVVWLSKVAALNPATSSVIQAWDRDGTANFALRTALLSACLEEKNHRQASVEEELVETANC